MLVEIAIAVALKVEFLLEMLVDGTVAELQLTHRSLEAQQFATMRCLELLTPLLRQCNALLLVTQLALELTHTPRGRLSLLALLCQVKIEPIELALELASKLLIAL